MQNAVKRAYFLANGVPLNLAVKDGRTSFTLPRPILDPMGTVIVARGIESDAVVR